MPSFRDIVYLILYGAMRRGDMLANRRAKRLLREYLTEQQRHELRSCRYFTAVGSAGGRYRFWPETGALFHLEQHGMRWYGVVSFCYHADGYLPGADLSLAHLLELTSDEPAFLAKANARRVANHWSGPSLHDQYGYVCRIDEAVAA